MNPPAKRNVLLLLLWLAATTACACKLPVFRYALERWTVDRYRIVAIVDQQQTDSAREALAELQSQAGSSANVDVEIIDLSKLSEEDFWQLEEMDDETETPRLQVFYPQRNGQRKKCWEGELTPGAVRQWFDSPLRQQIAHDIVSGVSVVWLMVDGLDDQQNQRIADQAESALANATAKITIPEGVIPRQDANRYLREHPGASMEDVLRSDVPLKVDFQLRRLARDNENEATLRAMIGGFAGQTDQALLVPIFGRGRMLDAIGSESFDEQAILHACRYMVGECSCTVKALNPGVDLILNVDWGEQLGQSVVVVDHIPSSEPALLAIPGGNRLSEQYEVSSRPMSNVWINGLCVLAIAALGYTLYRWALNRIREHA